MKELSSNIFYRPEWTCGRFCKEADAAIYYNLIDGMAYFFEDYSAQVIGVILSLPRNGSIELQKWSDLTGIAENSLMSFADSLTGMGLLVTEQPTKELVGKYRDTIHKDFTTKGQPASDIEKDDYPLEMNDAELAYKDKTGGVTSVMFELTYNCSEKCIHCYNIGASRNDEERSFRNIQKRLSFSDYQRIIDELYAEGLVKVCLSGGDPFSNSDIWGILDYLYSKDIAVDIYTNGLSITDKVKRVANYYPRLIGISLYSGIASEHDRITRVTGSWDKTLSVIKQFAALSVPMVLKCCVMRTNVKSYYMVSDIAKQYGVPVQYELNVTDSVDGDKCVSHYLRLSPDMLEIVLRDPNTIMYIGNDIKDFGRVGVDMNKNTCKAGYNTFCITPDGDLIPCCAFHLSFGNLKEQSLKDILFSSKVLHWWQALKIKDYEECGQYDYCAFCTLCAGINYSEHGTPLKASENNCYMAKVRCGLAKKMQSGDYDPLEEMDLRSRLNSLPMNEIGRIKREYSPKT